MIYKKKTLFLASWIIAILTIAGCVKEKAFFGADTGDGNRGQLVKIVGGGTDIVVVARDVVPAIDTFALIELRREASTPDQLNSALTVRLVKNDALRTAYNTAHGTNYIDLPAAAYQFVGGTNIASITFQPGEFVKFIPIRLDKSQISLSNQYAVGFSIQEVGSGGKISSQMKNVLYSVGVKNQYDGKYTLKGYFYHPTVTNQHYWTFNVEMHTSGPNSVKMFDPDYFGDYIHPWITTNASGANVVTGFGIQSPEYTINPTTNKVTVQNVAAGAVTFYTMAPGYDSRYDPATKTIYAKWGYNYSPGPVFNPAANREWTDTLIYVGPR